MRNNITYPILSCILGYTNDQQLHHYYHLVILGVQLRLLILFIPSYDTQVWATQQARVCIVQSHNSYQIPHPIHARQTKIGKPSTPGNLFLNKYKQQNTNNESYNMLPKPTQIVMIIR